MISLFIPVYNARKFIKDNLRKSYEALSGIGSDFQIFVVDDNSTDKSYRFKKIIDKASPLAYGSLEYVYYDNGPSRRENLARAFALAKGEIICFMDADFSCDISYLLKAIAILKEESLDIVVGSRWIKGAQVKRSFFRAAASFFYNLTLRVLFKSGIKDHQCGLKVFRQATAMPIIAKMGYDHTFTRGWFWDAEFLIRAQREKLKIREMPVVWQEADASTFNIGRELKCLKTIAALKRELG